MQANDDHDEYDTNIRIADLNSLNAALPVVWWKKHFGLYADFEREHFSTYAIETNLLAPDCTTARGGLGVTARLW